MKQLRVTFPARGSHDECGALVPMPNVTIDLQDGFKDDTVEIVMPGNPLLRVQNVTTKLLTGIADSKTVQVPEGSLDIGIRVPSRGLEARYTIDSQKDKYLGFSIQDGEIGMFPQENPFGYM